MQPLHPGRSVGGRRGEQAELGEHGAERAGELGVAREVGVQEVGEFPGPRVALLVGEDRPSIEKGDAGLLLRDRAQAGVELANEGGGKRKRSGSRAESRRSFGAGATLERNAKTAE